MFIYSDSGGGWFWRKRANKMGGDGDPCGLIKKSRRAQTKHTEEQEIHKLLQELLSEVGSFF